MYLQLTSSYPNSSLREKGPNMEFFSVRIQSGCGKIRTKKTPNKNIFRAVLSSH